MARRVPDGLELTVSGPFSLFRRTTLYGRAYASIAPRLPWCERFALAATCAVRGGDAVLRLGPADPIWPAAPPRRFDSALEERFASDLARRFPDWIAVREPDAVEADGSLVFPDFALHRADAPDRRWYLEIVGFWTPEYLTAKVARLASAGHGWVVCVDERLDCGVEALPDSIHVLPFRRRVDVAAVVARLAELAPSVAARGPEVEVPAGAVWLDWAGRRRPDDPLHVRLGDLRVGQEVGLRLQAGRVIVTDGAGLAVSAWSAAASAAWASRLGAVRRARVRALVSRTPAQSAAGFREALRAPAWVVPLVTVELGPPGSAGVLPPGASPAEGSVG